MKQRCPLCRERRGKRHCPAKGVSICPSCCGRKRLVEIPCPSDCVYLTGEHAPGWSGRLSEQRRDARRIGAALASLERAQEPYLVPWLAAIGAVRSSGSEVDDALLLDAVVALRKTADTRDSGILYEHAPADARAHALIEALRGKVEAAMAGRLQPDERAETAVLKGLENALRATREEQAGPTAFIETAARVTTGLRLEPGGQSSVISSQ